MFGTFFNHQQLRRFIVAFGSLFNDIEIRRDDDDGNEVQRMVVPLDYGPKERWLTRFLQDPEFLQSTNITVPRMAYEAPELHYDATRKLNSLQSLRFPTNQTHLSRLYVGVPYKLNFQLSILTKNQTDAFQIVEQIFPYFTPDYTFALKTIPELGLIDQVTLTLHTVTSADNYEGNFDKRRAIVWTLQFHMSVYFYGPVRTQKQITEVDINIYKAPWSEDLSGEPEYITTEDNLLWLNESGNGHIVTENTANVFISSTPLVEIQSIADPNQDPIPASEGGDVKATTTVTEL